MNNNEKILRKIIREELIMDFLGIGTHKHSKVKENLNKLRKAKVTLQDKLYSITDKYTKEKFNDAIRDINDAISNLSVYENDWI